MYVFAQNPDQWQKLLDDRSKIPAAVEELLRYEAPAQYNVRRSMREVHLHGETIPEGKPVFLIGGSANRDHLAWTDADKFDIDRDRTEAQNLGLGYGIHSCLGAALARMESAIALEKLLDFMPRYEVDFDNCRAGPDAERGRVAERAGEGAAMKKVVPSTSGCARATGCAWASSPRCSTSTSRTTCTSCKDEVTPDNEHEIHEAVRQCPRQAISIVED